MVALWSEAPCDSTATVSVRLWWRFNSWSTVVGSATLTVVEFPATALKGAWPAATVTGVLSVRAATARPLAVAGRVNVTAPAHAAPPAGQAIVRCTRPWLSAATVGDQNVAAWNAGTPDGASTGTGGATAIEAVRVAESPGATVAITDTL